MYFLESICSPKFQPIWNVVGFIVKAVWIGIPVLTVILGTIDIGKAVISSKEEEAKKAWKSFGRRLLYTLAIFLVVWGVSTVFSLATDVVKSDDIKIKDDWKCCWDMAIKGETTKNCDGVN